MTDENTATTIITLIQDLLEDRGEFFHKNLAIHWIVSETDLNKDDAEDALDKYCETETDDHDAEIITGLKEEYEGEVEREDDTDTEADDLTVLDGIGEGKQEALKDNGYETIQDILDAEIEDLEEVHGISNATATRAKKDATRFIDPLSAAAQKTAAEEREYNPDDVSVEAGNIQYPAGLPTNEHFNGLPVLDDPVDTTGKHPLVEEMTHKYYESDVKGVSMGLGGTTNTTFDSDKTNVELACKILADNDFCLALRGQTGTGKNMLLKYISSETNRPIMRVNFGTGMTYEELVGKTTLESDEHGNQTLGWQDGLLTMAMRYGWIFIADEMNAAPPEVMMPLHSVAEEDPTLTLKKTGEVLRPHPSFRFVATMNPPEAGRYGGTNSLNEAFKTRFYTIDVSHLPEDEEVKLVDEKVNTDIHVADTEDIRSMVKVANRLRNGIRKGDALPTASTREVIKAAKLCDIMAPKDALLCVLHGMMEPEHDSESITEAAASFF